MKKTRVLLTLLLSSVLAVCRSADAVTIDGTEFELFASMRSSLTNDRLGHWAKMSHFETFTPGAPGNRPINVADVQLADDLAGQVVTQFFAAGSSATATFDSTITSGVVNLYGANGQELLSATYSRAGVIDSTLIRGMDGQLNITGIYTVTGGQFLASGFTATQIYVEMLFANVTDISSGDIWSNLGRINIYRTISPVTENPPPSEVPEPASMFLLGSSLIALRAKKRLRATS